MWRLRKELHPKEERRIPNSDLRRAIMKECGTSPECYRQNRKALYTLKWINSYGKTAVCLTNKDLEEAI